MGKIPSSTYRDEVPYYYTYFYRNFKILFLFSLQKYFLLSHIFTPQIFNINLKYDVQVVM